MLSDQLISLGSDNAQDKQNNPVRLVVIASKPRKSKAKPDTEGAADLIGRNALQSVQPRIVTASGESAETRERPVESTCT